MQTSNRNRKLETSTAPTYMYAKLREPAYSQTLIKTIKLWTSCGLSTVLNFH